MRLTPNPKDNIDVSITVKIENQLMQLKEFYFVKLMLSKAL